MTDFNRVGSVSKLMAETEEPTRFSLLSPEAREVYRRLYRLTGRRPTDPQDARLRGAALGCMERLSAVLLQVERLATEARHIQDQAPCQPGEMIGVRAPELLFDFEALLFHSRSALDLVTFFVCKRVYGQSCHRFSKLRNALIPFEKSDDRARKLSQLISTVEACLSGVLLDAGQRRCLRSELMHRCGVGELSQIGFTLHCIQKDKRLALDTVVSGSPVLSTSRLIGGHVAFIVLNALSIYLCDAMQVEGDVSVLMWSHPFVDYTAYVTSDEKTSRIFTVWNPVPSGLTLTPVRLNDAICKLTY